MRCTNLGHNFSSYVTSVSFFDRMTMPKQRGRGRYVCTSEEGCRFFQGLHGLLFDPIETYQCGSQKAVSSRLIFNVETEKNK